MDAILIFLLIALVACIVAFFIESYREVKRAKEYDNFIQSIKVGDVFDYRDEPDTKYTNPFDKKEDPSRIVVISDIKENGAGYKWVQYYYKHDNESGFHSVDFYDEIHSFVRYRKRIQSKDVEN
jgi:hypothetical protein